MRRFLIVGLAPALLAGFAATALAQATQPPAQAPGTATPDAAKPDPTKPNEPLSKKLDESEGVITPPHGIDPEMKKEPPAVTGDKMPVIIPPGEPGGDQSVQPK